jgi:hypothetical protein
MKKGEKKRPIETYEHRDKQRVNNPPVGLVTPDTDPDAGTKKTFAYDPHLDPQLQWAGKAEHFSFEVSDGLAACPRAHRFADNHRSGQKAQRPSASRSRLLMTGASRA